MGLEKYLEKRKEGSNEPGVCEEAEKQSIEDLERPIYVVQEHHASHLHYDLRLEFDNVLKSWALPKGMPLSSEKRLGVQTEDHPLGYAKFKGIIPEGHYGAGKVIIWDRGTFELIDRKEDKIVVNIKGEKVRGTYIILRLKDKKNWLIFRKKEQS